MSPLNWDRWRCSTQARKIGWLKSWKRRDIIDWNFRRNIQNQLRGRRNRLVKVAVAAPTAMHFAMAKGSLVMSDESTSKWDRSWERGCCWPSNHQKSWNGNSTLIACFCFTELINPTKYAGLHELTSWRRFVTGPILERHKRKNTHFWFARSMTLEVNILSQRICSKYDLLEEIR